MRVFGLWWVILLGLAEISLGQPSDLNYGHIAVWHHGRPVVKSVLLPQSIPGRILATPQVQVSPLPENLLPTAENCYCYDVNDDRLAVIHAFYYAHNAIANYNQVLRDLKLPQLRDTVLTLVKDGSAPTIGTTSSRKTSQIVIRYSSPAIDPFTIDREVGRAILHMLLPHFRWRTAAGESALAPRLRAEEDGMEEGTANMLAALELGTSGNLAQTGDTLDAPIVQDVDTFVRFPDVVTTRRQVVKELTQSPRFAARYSGYVSKLLRQLDEPTQNDYLSQLDPNVTSAIINQPLWQVAVRYGFRSAKMLLLRSLGSWSSPDYGYVSYGRELVMQAQIMGPKWADVLSEEYQRRGLPVPDARLELKPSEQATQTR